ncbi:MAG: hypothetical protein ACREOY_10150 [Candidatus Dormibacteraceae bacterium]
MALKTIVVALLAASACACGSGPPDLASQAGPSPVVLTDTSAGRLAVSVRLTLGGYDTPTRDRTMIDVNFEHGGHPVRFVADERVACGGVPLQRFTGAFEGTVRTSSIAGALVTCVYSSGGQSAPISFLAPQPPVLLSPRDREQVPHGANTAITYRVEAGPTLWIVALSPQAKAVAKPDSITSTGATVDTTALQTGAGTIALTQPSLPLNELRGAQFESLTGGAWAATVVNVEWI